MYWNNEKHQIYFLWSPPYLPAPACLKNTWHTRPAQQTMVYFFENKLLWVRFVIKINMKSESTNVYTIPRITIISLILLPDIFEVTDAFINEHSVPESKQNRNYSPIWCNVPDEAQKSTQPSWLELKFLLDELLLIWARGRNGQQGTMWLGSLHLKQVTLEDTATILWSLWRLSLYLSARSFIRQSATLCPYILQWWHPIQESNDLKRLVCGLADENVCLFFDCEKNSISFIECWRGLMSVVMDNHRRRSSKGGNDQIIVQYPFPHWCQRVTFYRATVQ